MRNLANPELDDEVELVGDGTLGVIFRIRRFCCGSRIRTGVTSLVFFVVTGIAVAVSLILTRRKFFLSAADLFIRKYCTECITY